MKIKLTPKQKESRKMCKNIMKITWKICRRAARKFGGLASQYFEFFNEYGVKAEFSRTVIEFKTGNRCFVPKRCIFNY